ncbi:hypothetical protein FGRA07_05142 [Fusarium graminearum]|nr:hypothetical protein FGRA07_05142 [Fusarium graminearum]
MSYPSRYSAWRRSQGTMGSHANPLTINLHNNEELPKDLASHDVVIKIHAVSLNRRDFTMLNGEYPVPLESGGVPCSDAAGEVVATGNAVSQFSVGDRVVPIPPIGDHYPDNDGWHWNIGGATLACAGLTAWTALDCMKTMPKDGVVLLQGTGGISMIALMLCLGAGVQPIITSSSDEKLETIRKISPRILGINYKTTHDQVAEVKRLTNGRGVDYVLNNTGIPSVIDDIEMLRERDGTVSLVGALGGFEAVWKHSELIKLMTKRAKLKGVVLGTKAEFRDMVQFIADKNVSLTLATDERSFAFKDAKDAYDLLESNNFCGKIVIKVAE